VIEKFAMVTPPFCGALSGCRSRHNSHARKILEGNFTRKSTSRASKLANLPAKTAKISRNQLWIANIKAWTASRFVSW
jgi:predicted HicB family RNase H-like nuclease